MAPAARRRWWVYVLRCGDGSLYTGITNDLARRVAQHAAGRGARYTRSRLPVEIAYEEPAPDKAAALRREHALKRLSRSAKLALVAGPRRRRVKARRSPPGTPAGPRAAPR